MKIGFSLSNNQGIEDVHQVLGLATRAEELGFDSVWTAEHVFNVSYVYDRIGDKPYYEPLSILSYVAATTQRIGLGTSVLVLPYHNPMRLAKTAATLDVMSGGRLMFHSEPGRGCCSRNWVISPTAKRAARSKFGLGESASETATDVTPKKAPSIAPATVPE